MAKVENPIVDILMGEDVPPEWLVPNMVVQGSLLTLVGESGAGKSYISYTLGLALASGLSALSGIVARSEPKRVLYFDDENSRQDRDKYLRRAWTGLCIQNRIATDSSKHLKLLKANFWPVANELGHEHWTDTVEEHMVRVEPHALVFDTANACMNIEEENSNSENGRAIKQVKQLMRLNDPHVANAIVLKHAKTRTEKGQIRTIRGAKIWKDQSDGVWFQIKAGGRPRKDGLSLTRLISDKKRAYGLERPIYITPRYSDENRTGLILDASHEGSREHRKDERSDDPAE